MSNIIKTGLVKGKSHTREEGEDKRRKLKR
jgi:hypothetical protein